jgi:non-specific serine/threonine protein kinase
LGLRLLQAAEGDAEQALLAGLADWRALHDGWGVAQVLNMLGDLARGRGQDALARSRYEEALSLLREVGISGTVPSLLHNLGYLALHAGDLRHALDLFQQSLAVFRDQGDQRGVVDCLEGVAGVLAALDHSELAARLFGAAETLRQSMNASCWPANAADVARGQARVRAQLDPDAVSSAWMAGRALSHERAVAEALATEDARETVATPRPDQLRLTPREREVAALVAQGMTNRQIGTALVITEGTARLHVKHILQKLGFRSRSQIAAWVATRGRLPPAAQDIPLPH